MIAYRRQAFIFIGLALIFLSLIPILKLSTQSMGYGDSNRYYKIALNPLLFTEAPWGYRLLVPYLAWILPFSLKVNFMFISYLCFIAINLIIFFWFESGGFSILKSFCCCLFYSFSYAGVYNIHNFVHVGFFEELLFLLGFIAIQKNKFLPFVMVILIGSFAKETVLILIPLYWIANFRKREWRKISFKTMTLLFINSAIFFLIRKSNLLFINKAELSSYVNFYANYWLLDRYWSEPLKIIQVISSAYTVWIGLAGIGFLFSDKRLRLLTLLVPFSAAMIIIGADAERAIAITFPVFLLLMTSLFKLCTDYEILILLFINIFIFMAYNHVWIHARFYVPVIWLASALFYLYLKISVRHKIPIR